jgi:hypothetical protein
VPFAAVADVADAAYVNCCEVDEDGGIDIGLRDWTNWLSFVCIHGIDRAGGFLCWLDLRKRNFGGFTCFIYLFDDVDFLTG